MSGNKLTFTYEDKISEYQLSEATEEPFVLYGYGKDYRRLPFEVTEASNPYLSWQARMPAGGRLRFKTDSQQFILKLECSPDAEFRYSADVYEYDNGKYTYRATLEMTKSNEGVTVLMSSEYYCWEDDVKMREYVVFLPYGAVVDKMEVGIITGSKIEKPSQYKYDLPVLVYGSSIVHGAWALRSASVYSNILSRMFDADFINLGFAGNAHAEIPMMEYIADQKISLFIYDYDHNAPTVDKLKETHYRGYEIFRKKQPDTPVIMASKVDYYRNPKAADLRRAVIMESYAKGITNGDKNLYFVDGKDIYGENPEEYSYDGCHPNDAGYLKMAQAFAKVIKNIL